MRLCHKNLILATITSLWLAGIGVGTHALWSYASEPGAIGSAPTDWPAASRIQLDAARDTLLLFLHPRCPCSRATVAELEKIVRHCQQRVVTHVLFIKPAGAPDTWERSSLWDMASAIPGVIVSVDAGGQDAARFGAMTSGNTLLYSPSGQLLFRGGITLGRGEIGANAGAASLISLIHHEESPVSRTSVFGCPLLSPESATSIEAITP